MRFRDVLNSTSVRGLPQCAQEGGRRTCIMVSSQSGFRCQVSPRLLDQPRKFFNSYQASEQYFAACSDPRPSPYAFKQASKRPAQRDPNHLISFVNRIQCFIRYRCDLMRVLIPQSLELGLRLDEAAARAVGGRGASAPLQGMNGCRGVGRLRIFKHTEVWRGMKIFRCSGARIGGKM